jgi:uncharacterized protein HemY
MYQMGANAFAAKHFTEAALSFEAAAAARPHAAPYFMAAQAWEQADKPDRASQALGARFRKAARAA